MVKATLANVLSEFARTMVTDFPIQRILDRLVERIVDIMLCMRRGITDGDSRKVEVEQQPGSGGAMSLHVVI
jgi:hypothetical protein